MYSVLLFVHSVWRWLVLALALLAMYRAFTGAGGRSFDETDRKVGGAFVGSVHVQVLLGLVLAFGWSPITSAAYAQMDVAMKNKLLRFWAVEHLTTGLLAAVIATVARVRSKKATTDVLKHRRALWGYGLTLLVMLAAIPWPFRAGVGRSLLPTPLVSSSR